MNIKLTRASTAPPTTIEINLPPPDNYEDEAAIEKARIYEGEALAQILLEVLPAKTMKAMLRKLITYTI